MTEMNPSVKTPNNPQREHEVKSSVLAIPGIGNSGPDHWQTIWEESDPSIARFRAPNWHHPVCSSWVEAIDEQASTASESLVIVAHSLGGLAFVHWFARYQRDIRGALLVAIPDPNGSRFPSEASGFFNTPLLYMPFPTIVVSSDDDPYSATQFSTLCANAWGSSHVSIGKAGHINADSNLGAWREGRQLLEKMR